MPPHKKGNRQNGCLLLLPGRRGSARAKPKPSNGGLNTATHDRLQGVVLQSAHQSTSVACSARRHILAWHADACKCVHVSSRNVGMVLHCAWGGRMTTAMGLIARNGEPPARLCIELAMFLPFMLAFGVCVIVPYHSRAFGA